MRSRVTSTSSLDLDLRRKIATLPFLLLSLFVLSRTLIRGKFLNPIVGCLSCEKTKKITETQKENPKKHNSCKAVNFLWQLATVWVKFVRGEQGHWQAVMSQHVDDGDDDGNKKKTSSELSWLTISTVSQKRVVSIKRLRTLASQSDLQRQRAHQNRPDTPISRTFSDFIGNYFWASRKIYRNHTIFRMKGKWLFD